MSGLVAYDASSDEEENSSDEGSAGDVNNAPEKDFEGEQNTQLPGVSLELFAKLPAPKASVSVASNNVVEEDDEFLKKKATPPAEIPKPKTVKIILPALAEFKETSEDRKPAKANPRPSKAGGLLSLLPQPKHEGVFINSRSGDTNEKSRATAKVTSLVPQCVKNRMNSQKHPKKSKSLVEALDEASDNEEEDAEMDFFSLNNEEKLPEVSLNEINAMVAKRAAKMSQASAKIDAMVNGDPSNDDQNGDDQPAVVESVPVDANALQILAGSKAKRRRFEEVNVVELSGDQVLPHKDEWMRSAIASTTTYQPRGCLVDEEVAPGTRKKHQITYLAHQAKANEMELQAMWAANRHTRRQTQGKYGF